MTLLKCEKPGGRVIGLLLCLSVSQRYAFDGIKPKFAYSNHLDFEGYVKGKIMISS